MGVQDAPRSNVEDPKMQLDVVRSLTFIDDTVPTARDGGDILRKVAAVVIVRNPFAGEFGEDLGGMIDGSVEIGRRLSAMVVAAMAPYRVVSYGKGGIVGLGGQHEHINALVTSAFAEPLRDAIGGAAAWISSVTKRAAPGTPIDVPLAHKDALYVRSHYDAMTLAIPDGPLPNEIAVIVCAANRGRIDSRVGGLAADQIEGKDGLR